MLRCALAASAVAVATGAPAGRRQRALSGDHAHTEPEWWGEFDLSVQSYTWVFCKKAGAGHGRRAAVKSGDDEEYADATMLFWFTKAEGHTAARSEQAAEAWEAAEEASPHPAGFVANDGAVMQPDTAYEVTFDDTKMCTVLTTPVTAGMGAGHYMFYLQHFPVEFESVMGHYFKETVGWADVEPESEKEVTAAATGEDKPWGKVMGAAILVLIVTFSGVFLIVPQLRNLIDDNPQIAVCLYAFAAGALISCAFLLLLFESTHLIAVKTQWKEVGHTWRWGTMVMVGYLTPVVIQIISEAIPPALLPARDVPIPKAMQQAAIKENPAVSGEPVDGDTEKPEDGGEQQSVAVPEEEPAARIARARLLGSILVGDFMHNFVDGIFIGTGFRYCSNSLGWTITGATVAHEVAQEIADLLVLTDPAVCGIAMWKALVYNFLSGTSVIFGAITIMAADKICQEDVGMLLAYGAGVYLYIGMSECMPRVLSFTSGGIAVQTGAFISFIIGAVAIGLVLLDHEHCLGGGCGPAGADPHAGHAH